MNRRATFVSTQTVSLLAASIHLVTETPGVLGSRLTGAGFGGCTVKLVREAALPAFAERACVGRKSASRSVFVVGRMLEAGVHWWQNPCTGAVAPLTPERKGAR